MSNPRFPGLNRRDFVLTSAMLAGGSALGGLSLSASAQDRKSVV